MVPAQGEWVCLKVSKHTLFYIVANRTWKGLHTFSSYKKRFYKKPLVHHPKSKEQRLVDILRTKKQTSIIAPFFKIFKKIFLLFPKFLMYLIFLRNRDYIKWEN